MFGREIFGLGQESWLSLGQNLITLMTFESCNIGNGRPEGEPTVHGLSQGELCRGATSTHWGARINIFSSRQEFWKQGQAKTCPKASGLYVCVCGLWYNHPTCQLSRVCVVATSYEYICMKARPSTQNFKQDWLKKISKIILLRFFFNKKCLPK